MTQWFLIGGALFITMALSGTLLARLPLTAAILYLAGGFSLGPYGLGLLAVDPVEDAWILERAAEIALIVSVFTAGLKLRVAPRDPEWWLPIRLAFLSMLLTIAGVAILASSALGLPLGAAVLLGAILAPTDPVLASDVQMDDSRDRDRLRFGLTGEAGLNDGAAFPFVLLGLGLLGVHPLGHMGWRWFGVDVAWAIVGGLGIGFLLGTTVARFVVFLRRRHREAVGLDDFLALGLVSLSYGVALAADSYGFLAVFAAGLAMRRVEHREGGDAPSLSLRAAAEIGHGEEIATRHDIVPAYMAEAVLGFNSQLERICEVGIVVVIGAMISPDLLRVEALWFVALLFLVIRPVSVAIGLAGSNVQPLQRWLIAWFGIRGVGSIYYVSFAVVHELPAGLAEPIVTMTLAVVAASIVVHGVSVTPLMRAYRSEGGGDREARIPDRRGSAFHR